MDRCMICNEPMTKYDYSTQAAASLAGQSSALQGQMLNQSPVCRECVRTGRREAFFQRTFSQFQP